MARAKSFLKLCQNQLAYSKNRHTQVFCGQTNRHDCRFTFVFVNINCVRHLTTNIVLDHGHSFEDNQDLYYWAEITRQHTNI